MGTNVSRSTSPEHGTTRFTAGGNEPAVGLSIFNRVTTEIRDYHGYDVDATAELQDGLMTVVELAVRQRPGGPGVTGEGLRKIQVQQVIRHSLMTTDDSSDTPRHRVAYGAMRLSERDRLRNAGPTDETLQWVSFIYQVAKALGDPPAKAVYEAFEVSPRTGGLWVAKARTKGLLDA